MELEGAKVPDKILAVARAYKDNIDAFLCECELDYPEYRITKEQARSLIASAVRDQLDDSLAPAQMTAEDIDRKINRLLNDEVDMITKTIQRLRFIAGQEKDSIFRIESLGLTVSPDKAERMICGYEKRLLEIKKALADNKKATGGDVNVQVNLGQIVTDALNNIKNSEVNG